ncbi:MAG: CapA family protein [Polyangiales bacterium]
MQPDVSIALVGDLILGEPEPDFFFAATRSVLQARDLVIGHVEVPHTRRGAELAFDIPAEPSDPEHLHALGRAGFHVATLAGNHIYDFGNEGIVDTLQALGSAGVASCGAGLTLTEAQKPVQLTRRGLHIGVLSFNCAGPRDSWAAPDRAGCAYVRIVDQQGRDITGPGAAELRDTLPEPSSLRDMQDAIEHLARHVDIAIVSLHKGIVHTPATLAGYERPVAHAAVDAGAAIVVSHHAHILRGIELYRGRPVFHGLGNFVTVTRALSEDNPHPTRRAWAQRRQALFGFKPDPNYPTYPFHPEAKHALIADLRAASSGSIEAGFLPCHIDPSGQPQLCGRDARGQAVLDYVIDITRRAGLAAHFDWHGDRVVLG